MPMALAKALELTFLWAKTTSRLTMIITKQTTHFLAAAYLLCAECVPR